MDGTTVVVLVPSVFVWLLPSCVVVELVVEVALVVVLDCGVVLEDMMSVVELDELEEIEATVVMLSHLASGEMSAVAYD